MTLQERMAQNDWAIISATQESLGAWSHPTNVEANRDLLHDMVGLAGEDNVVELTGRYKGIDQGPSFLVFGLSPVAVLSQAVYHRQESVLFPEGLMGTFGGCLATRDKFGDIFGDRARGEDFYSIEVATNVPFSLGLMWE